MPKVQVSGPGRPSGLTKSETEKKQQRSEFERQVEDAVQKLFSATHTVPTKTSVAQEVGVGGRSPHTGNDTSLNAFNGKLKRLEIDYEEIIRRVTLTERPEGSRRGEAEHGQ